MIAMSVAESPSSGIGGGGGGANKLWMNIHLLHIVSGYFILAISFTGDIPNN